MNKGYICVDENVVIRNENNQLSYVKKTDNIEEFLVQENVVEQIKNMLQEKKKNFQDNVGNITISVIGSLLILGFLGISLILTMISFQNLDGVSIGILVSLFIASITGEASFLGARYISRKQNKALNNEIPFLEKSLELEKEKLQKLSLGKQIERKGVGITINEKEKLDLLKRKLQLYLLLKKRLEKNPSEFEKPSFNHELYTEEEMMEVKEMIESEIEKPKVLTKR